MASKLCPSCREDKDVAEYYPDVTKPSGVGSMCRPCLKLRSARRQKALRVLQHRHADEYQTILEDLQAEEGDTQP